MFAPLTIALQSAEIVQQTAQRLVAVARARFLGAYEVACEVACEPQPDIFAAKLQITSFGAGAGISAQSCP